MTKCRTIQLLVVIALAGCGDAEVNGSQTNEAEAQAPSLAYSATSRVEKALLDQISCKSPPQAGVAMSALLRQHLIARTDDGGDGIILFIPIAEMDLLGFPIVRMSGWQADPEGGAMKPFERGPGTSPPNHISITVKAGQAEVHQAFAELGVAEAKYVPDENQEAWVDSAGNVIQPQRLIPGHAINAGDDEMASNPASGATTIVCSADTYDFDRQIRAQFEDL